MNFEYALFSDKGPRSKNEDVAEVLVLANGVLAACVADGVGGQAGGDIAAKESVRIYLSALKEDRYSDQLEILHQAHEEILKIGKVYPEYSALATTFSGCVIDDGKLSGVHTGDSRIYILRGNGILQLTQDYTEVARLLSEGKLPKSDAPFYPRRNVLESALGSDKELKIQKFDYSLKSGDRILLTTDGVHGLVGKRELRDLSIKYPVAQEFVKQVVEVVNQKPPNDNFTLIYAVIL